MICFQDRYLTAGSYMLIDNSGQPLTDRVNAVIDQFIEDHQIASDQIMFFGASKGGSIAIQYAENHPEAHLVVVVPQMNIRYYLDKPFFRDNLFRESQMHKLVQPEQLIRSYFRQGRRIDYFYTNSDEQSNYSLIELIGDIPGLTKYRINGRHGDVARASLPTTLGIIRRFLGTGRARSTNVEEVNTYQSGSSLGVQVRIDDSGIPRNGVNWYLSGRIGRSGFRQILTDHSLPFIKYTADSQHLLPIIDDLSGIDGVVASSEDGDQWIASLPNSVSLDIDHAERRDFPTERLRLETSGRTTYAILRGDFVAQFNYDCRRGIGNADRIDVYVVDDLDYSDIGEQRHRTDARFVAVVECSQNEDLLELMIQRLHVASNCSAVSVLRYDQVDPPAGESVAFGGVEDHSVIAEI
ncbi:hypothetical protein D3I60_14650 [Brevibacterium permense]|nr:hypothetical protein [Brevibacterium permense]